VGFSGVNEGILRLPVPGATANSCVTLCLSCDSRCGVRSIVVLFPSCFTKPQHPIIPLTYMLRHSQPLKAFEASCQQALTCAVLPLQCIHGLRLITFTTSLTHRKPRGRAGRALPPDRGPPPEGVRCPGAAGRWDRLRRGRRRGGPPRGLPSRRQAGHPPRPPAAGTESPVAEGGAEICLFLTIFLNLQEF